MWDLYCVCVLRVYVCVIDTGCVCVSVCECVFGQKGGGGGCVQTLQLCVQCVCVVTRDEVGIHSASKTLSLY